jgi:glycosyltransferase involved in cell wall biosynthesis
MVPGTVFALRTSARARDDSLKVFALSNLLPSKCVHNTIEALAGVSATFRNRVVLHVIGDGVERPRLEELARLRGLRTVFHGYLPHIEAMRLLAAADLLVHASAYETFGIVLAEAAALGVPVVATRCGGPQDVVGENSGLLVEVDDVAALRTGVDAVLGNLEYWRAQSDKISRCAYDRFHESRVAAAIADTYR